MARKVHTSPATTPASDAHQYVLPWQQLVPASSVPEAAGTEAGPDHAGCPIEAEHTVRGPEGAPAQTDGEPTPTTGARPEPLTKSTKRRLRDRVERLLRDRCIPYVNVDEAKRALFASARLRSFHFVAYSRTGPNWLIFAAAANRQALDDMAEWERVFGEGFIAVFASPSTVDKTGVRFRTLDRRPLTLDVPTIESTQNAAMDRTQGGAQC